MKRLLTILVALLTSFSAFAQAEKSIIIEQKSFRAVQTDALTGVNIDPIGLDYSKRPCARLKVKINRMTKAEIDGIEVKPITNNAVMKCKTAEYDNGLIIEMTAKPQTRFYFHHNEFGDSNEVIFDLEADKEYYLESYLNHFYSIVVMSNVSGAEVYIDDVMRGRTDKDNQCSIKGVRPGKHLLKLNSETIAVQGYIDVGQDRFFFKLDLPINRTSAPYKVGDYYNDGKKEGVVFEVWNNGNCGKIVSLQQSVTSLQWASDTDDQSKIVGATDENNGLQNMLKIQKEENWRDRFPAFAWCASLGEGWYLPSTNELARFTTVFHIHDAVNTTLAKVSGVPIFQIGADGNYTERRHYWASTEDTTEIGTAYRVFMLNGFPDTCPKNYSWYVRAVAEFDSSVGNGHLSELHKTYEITSAPYRIGDYYNDGKKEGVVFEVSAKGMHGKIINLNQSEQYLQWASDKKEQTRLIGADSNIDGEYNMAKIQAIPDWQTKYPAFRWCADLGVGWYLPAIEELKILVLNSKLHDIVNRTLEEKGGKKLYNKKEEGWYWSSTECNKKFGNLEFCAWYINTENSYTDYGSKYYNTAVRAVAKF